MTFSVAAFENAKDAVQTHASARANSMSMYETVKWHARSITEVRGYFALSLAGGVAGAIADLAKTAFNILNSLLLGKFFSEGKDDIADSFKHVMKDLNVAINSAIGVVWPSWFKDAPAAAAASV